MVFPAFFGSNAIPGYGGRDTVRYSPHQAFVGPVQATSLAGGLNPVLCDSQQAMRKRGALIKSKGDCRKIGFFV